MLLMQLTCICEKIEMRSYLTRKWKVKEGSGVMTAEDTSTAAGSDNISKIPFTRNKVYPCQAL
jgi:hypothetical protein